MEYFKDCMTLDALKARYKEWVLKLHPDRNPDNPNAEAEFKEMQQQYEEREAELKGDYSKARKARERRERAEREAKERRERERKEQERRKVEMAIEQARKNRNTATKDLKQGNFIYAYCINHSRDWEAESLNSILSGAINDGVAEECVVMIDTIFNVKDEELLKRTFNNIIECEPAPMGGYEVLQNADLKAGVRKGRRVARVVMFRSPCYCIFANPMGDRICREYYLPINYQTMFDVLLDSIRAKIEHEQREKARIEEERKAKLLAEQAPLIEEWQDKLIELSRGLSNSERLTVAVDNLRCMLAHKYVGCRFKVKADKFSCSVNVEWEDGPTIEEVNETILLFETYRNYGEITPWMQKYGQVESVQSFRKISTLTKARILQQLGQVTDTFRNSELEDEVTMSDFDWMMLHLMGGVDVSKASAKDLCKRTIHPDGHISVRPIAAIYFVFNHTNYYKPRRKTAKAKN